MAKNEDRKLEEAAEAALRDLQTANKRIAALEQAQREDQRRIKELQEDVERYHRRAYTARIVVHELVDMALFEKSASTKY